MNIKKICIGVLFLLVSFFSVAFSSGILPGTNTNQQTSYDSHLLKKILDNYLTTNSKFRAGTWTNKVSFQGDVGGNSPIQNGCKLVQDDKSMEKYGFVTATCPEGTQVIWKDLGVYDQSGASGMSFSCVVPIKNDVITKFEPKIDINIEGECSGGELCKGIEPWYSVDKNTTVNVQIKFKPGSGDVKIGGNTKHIINPIWLDTIKVYINNTILPLHLNGDYTTENWDSSNIGLISLDGTGGVKGELGINYITTRLCDHPIDEETGQPVQSPDQTYKLNCVTKTFVVKLSPTNSNDVTSFSNLDQRKVKCSDFGLPLPANAKWIFPVTMDGSFYQSCTKDGNCTPQYKTVCNFKCEEGYIKDMDGPNGAGCYPEKELKDCNLSPVGQLKTNEEWKAPNGFSADQNVNPITGQFYGLYDLDLHDYTPNINYCQKGCKDGYNLDVSGVCKPIEKTIQCKNYFTLDHFLKYNSELVDSNNEPDKEYTITSFWQDKVDPNTNEMDGLIEEAEYDPNSTLLQQNINNNPCGTTKIDNAIVNNTKGHVTCDTGYVAVDSNQDGTIGQCVPFNSGTDYVVFLNTGNNTEDKIKSGGTNAIGIQNITNDCNKVVNDIDYYYNSGKVKACIK